MSTLDPEVSVDPLQAIASVSTLVDALKKARDIAKRFKDAEVLELLLDAQEQALSLKEAMVNVRAENLSLKEQLSASLVVEFEGGAYWANTETGRDGPYCSRCYDINRKAVRLHPMQDFWHGCPACEQRFEVTSAARKPDPPPIRRNLPMP